MSKSRQRAPDLAEKLYEYAGMALIGGATGAIYGLCIAGLATWVTHRFSLPIVGWSTLSFAILGIFFSNVLWQAILAIAHFAWGLHNGYSGGDSVETSPDTGLHLRAIALVGLVTGMILWWTY
jgi:hypothetical protein